MCQYGFQAAFAAVAYNQALLGHGADEMVELGLDGGKVGENVGVVVFEIVEDGGARAVVDEFAAFVEKCGVVFVGFDHEKRRLRCGIKTRRLRQAGGNAEVLRDAADEKAGGESGVFEHPGEHGGGGGFAVGAGNAEHPASGQHVFRQPLRAGGVGQRAVQNGFDHGHTAFSDVADHINIGGKMVELFRIEAFVHGDAQRFELGAHGRIHFGVAAGNGESGFFGQRGQPSHKGAADADDVDVGHGEIPPKQKARIIAEAWFSGGAESFSGCLIKTFPFSIWICALAGSFIVE